MQSFECSQSVNSEVLGCPMPQPLLEDRNSSFVLSLNDYPLSGFAPPRIRMAEQVAQRVLIWCSEFQPVKDGGSRIKSTQVERLLLWPWTGFTHAVDAAHAAAAVEVGAFPDFLRQILRMLDGLAVHVADVECAIGAV